MRGAAWAAMQRPAQQTPLQRPPRTALCSSRGCDRAREVKMGVRTRPLTQRYWAERDATAARQANWRTLRLGIEGTCTADDLRELRAKQGDRCAYCQCVLDRAGELDHIVPVSRGGSSHPSNLCWACQRCNALKRDRDSFMGRDTAGTGRGQAKLVPPKFADTWLYWWMHPPANVPDQAIEIISKTWPAVGSKEHLMLTRPSRSRQRRTGHFWKMTRKDKVD
jgi:5-methylcytosine-specific restriction endonuclease McrA